MTISKRIMAADELEGETLEGVSLHAASLEKKTFVDCTFVDAELTEAALRRCLFENCVFRGCDLTMMSPYDTSFRETRFERTKLMGVDWTKAHQLTFNVQFHECVLSYCSFDAMALSELLMTDCKAVEAVFTDANLTGADLSGTDLSGSVFLHTVLANADLSLATNYAIDPTTNTLKDTKFSLEGALRSMALLGVRVPSVDASE